MNKLWLALASFTLMLSCNVQVDLPEYYHAPFLQTDLSSMDSVLLDMNANDKIGQLLFYMPDSETDEQSLYTLAERGQFTGIQLSARLLPDYLRILRHLQELSSIPLLNATSENVSLNNQFAELLPYPTATTITARGEDTTRAYLEEKFLREARHLGINLCFNPFMGPLGAEMPVYSRQFYDHLPEQQQVAGQQKIQQFQDTGLMIAADAFRDFYYIENDSTHYVDSLLLPMRQLVESGLSGLVIDPMVFQQDSLETLPPQFLRRYLKEKLDFDGLIMAQWDTEVPFELLAYAGVDIFMVKDSVAERHAHIRQYVENETFTERELNLRVRKVLLAKQWLGERAMPESTWALANMQDKKDEFWLKQLHEESITLLQNPDVLPFSDTYKQNFRLLRVGNEELWQFQYYFSKYASFSESVARRDSAGALKPLRAERFRRARLIVHLEDEQLQAQRDTAFIQSVNAMAAKTPTVVINYGSPHELADFDSTVAIVQLYEHNKTTEALSAQLLFGAFAPSGQLPLAVKDRWVFGAGIQDIAVHRLKFTEPEEVGMAPYRLVALDALARKAIREGATPGCQVLVAKNGKIVYSKTFGTHDIDKKQLVQKNDLYDLASITKVAATGLATMQLYDQGKIKLKQRLQQHLPLDKTSPIRNLNLQQLLTHQSGLQSNMPIAPYIMYKDTSDARCNDYFCRMPDATHQVAVADSFYLDQRWQDSIWQEVFTLQPRRNKRYLYSDVNFNLLQKVIETKTGQALNDYLNLKFYYPLNLRHCTYQPLKNHKAEDIVPTAKDEYWRKQLLRGYVHDESAALLGGVGGNAGLFSNAEDLAVLFQMLLNGGSYGGKQYVSPETVRLFTSEHGRSGRGLGFDVQGSGTRSCSRYASAATYGHTGFTGTCVWVDPKEDLIFIFLSNRINPSVKNRKLFRESIRRKMHDVVYEALDSFKGTPASELDEPIVLEANAGNSSGE